MDGCFTRLFGGLLVALAILLVACSSSASPSPVPTTLIDPARTPSATSTVTPSASPAIEPSASLPTSPLTGVVTAIDASGLDRVNGFTIRTADARTWTLRIGTLENGAQFPPGHLKEHQATSTPVRVFFRAQGSDLVVYRIEDAG
jgi:hypothetical protein